MKEKEKKEKPIPLRCKCGVNPAIIKVRGAGYIVSCRDPLNCFGNFITFRNRTEEGAIIEWNNLIRYGGENK